ncbi:MAG: radical SAM protein [Candidatus Firestonebacteria bacterium]
MTKLYKRLSLASKYVFRNTACNTFPLRLGIEVTNNCNLACSMCPRQNMTRKIGDMDFELFKNIIDEGKKYLELVCLQDVGEPLMNKNIFRMIEYCKLNDIRTLISTNATLLDNKTTIELLDSGIDYIIFAFDGTEKETYENIRIGANYNKVIENIKGFLAEKTKRKAKTFCTLQCIYMDKTERKINEFRKMWNIDGVDAIRIRQITYGVDLNNPVQKKYSNINYKLPCYWLWSDPYVKWDGTLVPCCQDTNAIYPLGNTKNSSIQELWNNQKMQDLRKLHTKGKYNTIDLCKNCNMYKPITPLILGSAIFNTFKLQKLIPKIESILCKLRY